VDAALHDEIDNKSPTLREQIDGGGEWYQGDLAFNWDEGKANILDNISLYADSYCDWYRLGYHECIHDEDNPQPCSWDEKRENGTIPSDIPEFT
jgi:hypothetical protein